MRGNQTRDTTHMNTDPDKLAGRDIPLITSEDGSTTDIIGVPSMLTTKPRGYSRFSEEEDFATEMKRRFDRSTKKQAPDARNHY
jgi:hypothetical protein